MGIRNKAMTMYQSFSKTEDQFLQGNVLVTSKKHHQKHQSSSERLLKQLRVFCTEINLPHFGRIETKENFSVFVFCQEINN